jgi:glycerol-3-phosphate acyltransferase PlsY
MFTSIAPLHLAAALIGGYLLGSIPFGVLVMRAAGAGDPRAIGSGNIGATNVLRSGRKGLALITLLGDGGKGALAVFIAWLLTRDRSVADQAVLTSLAGGAAFVGHLFPVWLGFKGGKGVATFFGTLLAACWPVGIMAGATWLLMAAVFRISSLAALTASLLAPIYVHLVGRDRAYAWLALFMAVLIWIRHAPNIRRLMKGEEPKIGATKKEAA